MIHTHKCILEIDVEICPTECRSQMQLPNLVEFMCCPPIVDVYKNFGTGGNSGVLPSS